MTDVKLGDGGYVYATLPARDGVSGPAFGLLSHVDTSPEQPGENVVPVVHAAWDGQPIRFADDPALVLSIEDCDTLEAFVGDDIITASGQTLLGADDKAGIAEILAAVAALQRFTELPHGEIRVCFTSDEEVGRGVEGIDLDWLPDGSYTVDGGLPGHLEWECFDAWGVTLSFTGVGVHPGSAKDRLVNATTAASRLIAALPPEQTPERTDARDGFLYVYQFEGGCETATVKLIVRDFERARNQQRIATIEQLAKQAERETPGLQVVCAVRHQYPNMREVIDRSPEVIARARQAIEDCGIQPITEQIRGGTDGSVLSIHGKAAPNLFCGGQLAHSRREWIARSAMVQAAEMLLHLARRWSESRERLSSLGRDSF